LSATPGQLRVLKAIVQLTEKWRYPPTVREICAHLGLSSTNAVAEHVTLLRWSRFVDGVAGSPRTLRVTELGFNELERHRLYLRASGAEVAR
jgi:repressor LexA